MKTKLFVLITLALALSTAAFSQGDSKEETTAKLLAALQQRPIDAAKAIELIRKGAEVNVYKEKPMLNRAIPSKNVEIVKAMLDAGADPNNYDAEDGLSALHEAAGYDVAPEMIALLIRYKADPNRQTFDGRVPLHYIASFSGDPKIAEELIKGGATPNIKTKYGKTPLQVASANREDVAAVMRAATGAAPPQPVKSVENKPAVPGPEDGLDNDAVRGVADYVLARQKADGYRLMDEGFAESQGRNSNDPSIGVKQSLYPRELTRFVMISTDGIMINAVMNGTLLTVPCTGGCQTSISTYITAFNNEIVLDGYKVQTLDISLINFQNNFVDYILKTRTPGSEVKWMYFTKKLKRS